MLILVDYLKDGFKKVTILDSLDLFSDMCTLMTTLPLGNCTGIQLQSRVAFALQQEQPSV